jgi:hypothetical protein
MTRVVMATGLLCILLTACERDAPPKPVGSAVNKHFEESSPSPPRHAAGAVTGAMKSPLEQAQHAEGVLQGAAEVTNKQAEQATP